jgi:hypothetical protein
MSWLRRVGSRLDIYFMSPEVMLAASTSAVQTMTTAFVRFDNCEVPAERRDRDHGLHYLRDGAPRCEQTSVAIVAIFGNA